MPFIAASANSSSATITLAVAAPSSSPETADESPAANVLTSAPAGMNASAQARLVSGVMSTPTDTPNTLPAGASEPQVVKGSLYHRCDEADHCRPVRVYA
jgi:hypothetical protein